MTHPTALFDLDHDDVVPTALSRGPWDPRHCHGGPVAALLTRAVESVDTGVTDARVVRLSFELSRPVPVNEPLRIITEVERPGRHVGWVGARLRHGDVDVARVRSLQIRGADLPLPLDDSLHESPFELGEPGSGQPDESTWTLGDGLAFHLDGCELRFVVGGWRHPGPGAAWIRLKVPVVNGETPSPLQRVAAAVDFGSGVSAGLPGNRYTFINPDLTVHVHRQPEGEWIALASSSFYGHHGHGMAESVVFDAHGRVGRSTQSLLIAPRVNS